MQAIVTKIMHACWDFAASNAQTEMDSALDNKHQNQSKCALYCHRSGAKHKLAVINSYPTKWKLLSFCMRVIRHFTKITNKIHIPVRSKWFNPTWHFHICKHLWGVWIAIVCKILHNCLWLLWHILSINHQFRWLQHAHSVYEVYELCSPHIPSVNY